MPKKPALETSKRTIASSFDKRRPRVYRLADIRSLLEQQREAWKLPANTRASQLISALEEEGGLRQVKLRPEVADYRDMTRYVWGACTPLEIASTIKESGYLTHGTAVFLHGLTEQVPRTIYINCEQTPKPSPDGPLTQEGITRSFKGRQSASRYTFHLEGSRYTILSGKNTKGYGVEEMVGPSGETLRVTGLERTLVDIVVRPAYAGGLYQVLDAYKAARERDVSVSRVLAALRALDYKYPYHQSIGFLMERAGFGAKGLQRLRDLGTDFDFYLDYGMEAPDFDESWRVFCPQGF
jgi:predicted transcriptional regulator of viral defense system